METVPEVLPETSNQPIVPPPTHVAMAEVQASAPVVPVTVHPVEPEPPAKSTLPAGLILISPEVVVCKVKAADVVPIAKVSPDDWEIEPFAYVVDAPTIKLVSV